MDGNNMGNGNQYSYSSDTGNNEVAGSQSYYYDNYETGEEAVSDSNIFGLIGMIAGIVGCVIAVCCCCGRGIPVLGFFIYFLHFILGVGALVLGIIGLNKRNSPKGMARAALIMGIVILVLFVFAIIGLIFRGITAAIFSTTGGILNAISPELEEMLEELMTEMDLTY